MTVQISVHLVCPLQGIEPLTPLRRATFLERGAGWENAFPTSYAQAQTIFAHLVKKRVG